MVKCDVCGRDTEVKGKKVSHCIGIKISENQKEIYPEMEVGKDYRVCFVCWLKSMGLKFKKK